MQINSVNNVNFGAIPDKNTKELLKNLANNGVDVMPTMSLMRSIYADKRIITRIENDGFTRVDLFNASKSTVNGVLYADFIKNIAVFSTDKLKNKRAVDYELRCKLNNMANARTKEQKMSDKIENFFCKNA